MLGSANRDRAAERREATRQEIVGAAWQVARSQGLAQVTLGAVAGLVGMRAPSLYTHFASKNAIYDAMFAQAWSDYLDSVRALEPAMAIEARRGPRHLLRHLARHFFDYAVSDLARHQLMNQRTIPGFEPSPESYAPAVAVLEDFRQRLADLGVTRQEDVDICVALIGGLIDAQLANDLGGDRWARLLDRAVDMFADNVNLPRDDHFEDQP